MHRRLGWSRSLSRLVLVWILGLVYEGVASAQMGPKAHTNINQLSSRTVLAGYFPAQARIKLTSAIKVATKRVRKNQRCRSLFDPYTTNGVEAFELTSYHLAGPGSRVDACGQQGVVAFTTVGGHRTHLCSAVFSRLNTPRAATVLIHEALHRAGMSEWPLDPEGKTSAEINLMVQRSCNL